MWTKYRTRKWDERTKSWTCSHDWFDYKLRETAAGTNTILCLHCQKKPLFPVSKRFGGIEKESYFNATKSGILQSPRQYGVTWVFPKYTKGVRNQQWVEYECSVALVSLKCSVCFKICMWFWLQGCIKGHSIALHENVQYVKSQTLWVVIYLWFPKSIFNHFL